MDPLTSPRADDSEATKSSPPGPPSTPTFDIHSTSINYEIPDMALSPAAFVLALAQGQAQSFQGHGSEDASSHMIHSSAESVIDTETEVVDHNAATTGAHADTGLDTVSKHFPHQSHASPPPTTNPRRWPSPRSLMTPAEAQTLDERLHQCLVDTLDLYGRETRRYESTMAIIAERRRSEVARVLRSDDPKEREEARMNIALLTKREEFCQKMIEDLGFREKEEREVIVRHRELEKTCREQVHQFLVTVDRPLVFLVVHGVSFVYQYVCIMTTYGILRSFTL